MWQLLVGVLVAAMAVAVHTLDFLPGDWLGFDNHTLYDPVARFNGYGLVGNVQEECQVFVIVATVKRIHDTNAVREHQAFTKRRAAAAKKQKRMTVGYFEGNVLRNGFDFVWRYSDGFAADQVKASGTFCSRRKVKIFVESFDWNIHKPIVA